MNISPAPILLASSSKSIKEIIDLMIEEKTSYVLLVNERQEISGIFTDRDVLKKFPMLAIEENLKHGIFTIMNKPVKTLPLSEIFRAAQFMQQNNIRHVPILNRNMDSGRNELVGIVTADSLFKSMSEMMSLPILFPQLGIGSQEYNIGVISPDGAVFSLLRGVLSKSPQMNIQRLWYGELQDDAHFEAIMKTSDVVIMDIDDFPVRSWTQILRQFNQYPKVQNVCVLLEAKKHPATVLKTIEELKTVNWLHVYFKPINITNFITDLSAAYTKSTGIR